MLAQKPRWTEPTMPATLLPHNYVFSLILKQTFVQSKMNKGHVAC